MELIIDRLTKQYGSKIAVDRVSDKLTTGVCGLLGANGAGKTTLMRMLCGILTPTSGEILLDGSNIIDMGEEYRDLLGYLPQDFGYYPDFTAIEFLHYISALKGLSKQTAKIKSRELLEIVGLSDVSHKKIKTFSGGMKQRLGIAQSMLNDPKIVVLDEPTAGLDPKERVRFRNLISNFSKDKIVILSTHIVSDIEYIADQILMMKKGSLLMTGTVEELTTSVKGSVWSCIVSPQRAEELEANYCISNLKHEGDQIELRIVSKEPPTANAISLVPTLEDLYLNCFQEEIAVEQNPIERGA